MQTAQQPSESGSKLNVRCSLSWADDDQHLIERGLRKVLCLLTCYIDFPEQLRLYKAQEVNDGSCVDDKGDPLTGTVQECHISDVPLQDFHLCLALESCKGSRQQSKRPAGHRKLSSDRSGEGLYRCWSCWPPRNGSNILRLANRRRFPVAVLPSANYSAVQVYVALPTICLQPIFDMFFACLFFKWNFPTSVKGLKLPSGMTSICFKFQREKL